jgi:uncharacterized Zn finger protein
MAKLIKKGVDVNPVVIEGQKITRTFWGQSWCKHLESFSDYSNRLPRGRTYVRNGSVCHLKIDRGEVTAIVSGSSLYDVKITVTALPAGKWNLVKKECAGKIGSILELLQGKLSQAVMTLVTDRKSGLFPLPHEIRLFCSCPDWAEMCKHVAAVLYGVGARLDTSPELLFLLRAVDHEELIELDIASEQITAGAARKHIADDDLANMFGIDIFGEQTDGSPPKVSKAAGKAAPTVASTAAPTVVSKVVPKVVSKKSSQVRSKPSKEPSRTTSSPLPKFTNSDVKSFEPQPEVSRIAQSPVTTKTAAKGKTKEVAKKDVEDDRPLTGKAIKEIRLLLNLDRFDFAELIGVTVPTVERWEKTKGLVHLQSRTFTAIRRVATGKLRK